LYEFDENLYTLFFAFTIEFIIYKLKSDVIYYKTRVSQKKTNFTLQD